MESLEEQRADAEVFTDETVVTPEENNPETNSKVFTQAEVNEIVKKRVQKVSERAEKEISDYKQILEQTYSFLSIGLSKELSSLLDGMPIEQRVKWLFSREGRTAISADIPELKQNRSIKTDQKINYKRLV